MPGIMAQVEVLGNALSTSCVARTSSPSSLLQQNRVGALEIVSSNFFPGQGGCCSSLQQLKRIETLRNAFSDLFGLQMKQESKKPKRLPRIQKRRRSRAEFAQEAPFVIAIGACILSSFAFPVRDDQGTDREKRSLDNSSLGADDVRYGAMGIISFIPLFNWLAWVFAWLDTSEQRYLFYSIVYLAPYIRTGFSLSPDDSWLPIASLLACIIHVQVDISVNTGGQLGNVFLRDATEQLSSKVRTQELREQIDKFMGRIQKLAEKTESPSPQAEEPELPPEEEYTRSELLEFDEKLAGLKGLKKNGEKMLEKPENIELDEVAENSDL